MLRERTWRSAVSGGGGGAVRAVRSQGGGAVARWRKRRVGVGLGVSAAWREVGRRELKSLRRFV